MSGAKAFSPVLGLARRAVAPIERLLFANPGVAVPLIVALLMTCASVAVSKQVLDRLAETQASHFSELTGAYLDGLSTALHPYVLRRDAWETFDVIDRARTRYAGIDSRLVLVILNDETVLASSDPIKHPLSSAAPAASRLGAAAPSLDAADGAVWIHRRLQDGGVPIGRIAARIDVGRPQSIRRETLIALILFNAALTGAFIGLGFLLVRRMMKPLMRLSDHMARSQEGRLEPIATVDLPPEDTDVGRAYRRYNTAAAAIAEREALLQRLAEQERRALIGRYASAMAHEVNNPLGGLFNAVKMIQRYGDNPEQRHAAARLLERGLTGIHNVVRASLMTWRGETDNSALMPADIDDILYLIQSEANRRELKLDWNVQPSATYRVPAQAVRQIALNLLFNACAASQPGGLVRFSLAEHEDGFAMCVEDQGPGMQAEARATLLDQAEQSRPSVTGLGLWAVSRLVTSLKGSVTVEGPPGTRVTVSVPNAARNPHDKAVA